MKIKALFYVTVLFVILSSCATSKDVVYFQDAEDNKSYKNVDKREVVICQDDILAIMVNSQIAEAAQPFNLPMTSFYSGGEGYGQQRILGYHVDKDGKIDFPVLGKLHVEGLTRNKLRDTIKEMLISEGQLKDPIVTINFLNFRVSVQGEVNRPGNFNISGERVTLLDALSLAGDLTIYGRRDRVAVIRESEGNSTIFYHDLRSTDLFASPCYYLQQNDVVYVEPNKRRAQQSNINQNNSVSVWLSIISFILTTTTVIVSLTK